MCAIVGREGTSLAGKFLSGWLSCKKARPRRLLRNMTKLKSIDAALPSPKDGAARLVSTSVSVFPDCARRSFRKNIYAALS